MTSIRDLIERVKATTHSRTKIAEEVWKRLDADTRQELGQTQLRRLIAAELNDPNQLEFVLDGEPLPLEEVDDLRLLEERGYRLIKMGKSAIRRGEAYVAEAKRRRERKHG